MQAESDLVSLVRLFLQLVFLDLAVQRSPRDAGGVGGQTSVALEPTQRLADQGILGVLHRRQRETGGKGFVERYAGAYRAYMRQLETAR